MLPKPNSGSDRLARKRKHDREAKAFRDAVWARDGRYIGGWQYAECARCHCYISRGDTGTVDHIKPRSTHPELKTDPKNGRLVCVACNGYLKTHPTEREV